MSLAPASAVRLLLEQRFGSMGNTFLNFVDSEDLSHHVRRSSSCPILPARQPLPCMVRATEKEDAVCKCISSASTHYTETDLETVSTSDDELSWDARSSLKANDWEASSELEQPLSEAVTQRQPAQRQPMARKEAAVTTLMLQNLPPHFAQKDLAAALERLDMEFDFLYVPSNFRTGAPLGYAFVNFTSAAAAAKLKALWAGRRPWGGKPLTVLSAAVQGLEANARKWDTAKMRRVRNPEHKPIVKAQGRTSSRQ